jgi:hypothetical protein
MGGLNRNISDLKFEISEFKRAGQIADFEISDFKSDFRISGI